MGDYVPPEAIKNQIENWNRKINDDINYSDKEQKSIDETTKKLKEADKALIEDFMKGLIHYIYNQRARKRK